MGMSHDLTLEDQLCFSLYATSMAISRFYKPLLDGLGITYPQYLVLSALWEADGQAVGAIAERLSLDSSTITPLVKRLEAASLVTRARQADDERRVLVSLTDRGRALKQDSRCLGEALFARAGMPAADLIALNREVRRLRAALAGANEG
jgi:DNA-binding MarR family transcriptional regulator